LISELIDGAWHGRTRLLITHRLSVLEKVDRVLFIEDGQIVASGPFEELLQTSQKVRDFVASVRRGDAQAKPTGAKTEEAQVATEEAESVVAAVNEPSTQEVPDGQA
jgi:ABC-type multidrug transport system ATPase subunit